MWSKVWFIGFILALVGMAYFAWTYSTAATEAQRLSDYGQVQQSAAAATNNYNTLNVQYKNLSDSYTKVSADYNKLQQDYQSLVTDYNTLAQKYNALGGK